MGLRYANYDIMECDRRSYKTRCFISCRCSVPKIRISIIVSLNLDVSIFYFRIILEVFNAANKNTHLLIRLYVDLLNDIICKIQLIRVRHACKV